LDKTEEEIPKKPKINSNAVQKATNTGIVKEDEMKENTANQMKEEELEKEEIVAKTSKQESFLKYLTDESWNKILAPEFKKDYFKKIITFLEKEKKAGKKIFPPEEEIFSAFNLCPFKEVLVDLKALISQVKVVIIGQDPYHGEGQAHGLCFSVRKGVSVPPSLRVIYKELQTDIPGFVPPNHGNLEGWARQGSK
jgi:hypothetical protein